MSDVNQNDDGEIGPRDIDHAANVLPVIRNATQADYDKLLAQFYVVSSENDVKKRRIEQLDTALAVLERKVESNEILDSLIKPMADKIFAFMCCYCVFVGFAVLWYWTLERHLAENTLNILAGSTAVTVLGLVGTIVAGIFRGARRGKN